MKIAIVTHTVARGDGQGRVNLEIVQAALAAGFVPVLSPLARGPLNVNADEAAGAPTSFTGSLSANLKSMKNSGSNTSSLSCFGFTGVFSGRVKNSVRSVSLYSR